MHLILGLIIGYLFTPKKIFSGYYTILGVLYISIFALTLTCITKIIKEKIVLLKIFFPFRSYISFLKTDRSLPGVIFTDLNHFLARMKKPYKKFNSSL